jgi:hypothetical protein
MGKVLQKKSGGIGDSLFQEVDSSFFSDSCRVSDLPFQGDGELLRDIM